MSKHVIHNILVEVDVHQLATKDVVKKKKLISDVVNFCQNMDVDEFQNAVKDMSKSQGTKNSLNLLNKLDSILAKNYTPRYVDDFPPIVEISEVRDGSEV